MALPHNLSRLNSISDYLKYFENLAFDHTDIQHTEDQPRFYTRFDDITGHNITYPLLLCIHNGTEIGNQRDSIIELHTFQLWVLDKLGSGKPADAQRIIDNCKSIADDFWMRIEYDSDPGTLNEFIHHFLITRVTGEAIDDPILGDKLIGWALTLSIGNNIHAELDDTNKVKWRSLS